uniref:DUF3730 domain-containing protein n=1 Tax=Lepeophtheirus salmonis TaxID=72036 RepID=A0A0K2TUB8_LEPSM
MDEIKDRLSQLSESPFTDSLQILNTIHPIAEELYKAEPLKAQKICELLQTALGSRNPCISSAVIEVLSRWKASKNISTFVQELLYQLPRAAYPGTFVSAIGRLESQDVSRTYLPILKHCPSSWPWVLDEIQKGEFKSFNALYTQILLDPSPSLHLTPFRVALRECLLQMSHAESQLFIKESLQWLNPTPENRFWILEITKKECQEKRLLMYSALIINKVITGMDPSELLKLIQLELRKYNGPDNILSVCLVILTKAFDKSFFGHYMVFLQVFKDFFDVIRNKNVLGICICSLLGITLVPSKLLDQNVWTIASTLIKKYYKASDVGTKEFVGDTIYLQWNKDVNLSFLKVNLLSCISHSETSCLEWLSTLSNVKLTLEHLPIVKTLFLGTSYPTVLQASVDVLSRILDIYPQRSMGVLSIILHKLSKEKNPGACNVLIKSLSIVAKDKNCIKFVIKVINSLTINSRSGTIKLKLLFDLYQIEERTYAYLHKALEEKYSTDESNVTKAFIILRICSKKSSKHASDLLPLLSDILNGQGHGSASVLALKAIQAMVADSVIDIETTFKALQPKIMADGLNDVRIALIEICTLIPEFDIPTDKYETFSSHILKFLWSCTVQKQEHPMALRKAAFSAIGKYGLYRQKFDFVPSNLTNGFNPIELVENEETNLYVPGECWIEILINSTKEDLVLIEDLLMDFLRDEVHEFPKSVYYLPHKKNEKTRMDYSQVLSETSVLRYILECCQSKDTISSVLASCLRILSIEYSQQFPPLNWEFLSSMSKNYKPECFNIIVNQLRKSECARNFLEGMLISEMSFEMILCVFKKLEIILQYHPCTELKTFIQNVSSTVIDETPLISLLDILKEKASICGKYDVFINFIKSLHDHVHLDSLLYSHYLELIENLPHDPYWTQLSNPTLSNCKVEVDLMNAFRMRRILSRKDKNSLIWFNDCIEALTTHSGVFDSSSVLQLLLSAFIESRENAESNRLWLMDFMGLILSLVRRKKQEYFPILFDVFISALVVFSGVDTFIFRPIISVPSSKNKTVDFLASSIQVCLTSSEKPWNTFGIQLGDWLLSFLKDDKIDKIYKEGIRSSLSSFKYGNDFDEIYMKLIQNFYGIIS